METGGRLSTRDACSCAVKHVNSAKLWLLMLLTVPLLLGGVASVADAAIAFVHPPDKSVVRRSDYLVLKLNSQEFTGVKIVVNGIESDLLQIGTPEYRKAFRDFLILQATWDPGKNSVTVQGYKGSKIAETAGTEIYFKPKSEGEVIPEGFTFPSFHTADNEKLCAPCHNMNPTAAQTDESLGKGNPCFGCHGKMINIAYVHGPAGTFSCTFCHTGGGNVRFSVSRRDATLCGECHVDQVADFQKRKFKHGPVEAGLCEICHDPHGSAHPAQLRAPINELCLSCHESIAKTSHVMTTAAGSGHPLAGVPDPSRPGTGRMLSCASCHNPHAGNVRFFFPISGEEGMGLCQICHNK